MMAAQRRASGSCAVTVQVRQTAGTTTAAWIASHGSLTGEDHSQLHNMSRRAAACTLGHQLMPYPLGCACTQPRKQPGIACRVVCSRDGHVDSCNEGSMPAAACSQVHASSRTRGEGGVRPSCSPRRPLRACWPLQALLRLQTAPLLRHPGLALLHEVPSRVARSPLKNRANRQVRTCHSKFCSVDTYRRLTKRWTQTLRPRAQPCASLSSLVYDPCCLVRIVAGTTDSI